MVEFPVAGDVPASHLRKVAGRQVIECDGDRTRARRCSMDPQITWMNLQEAYLKRDWDDVRELAQSLLDWLQRGGFPPTVLGTPHTDPDLHRDFVQAFCRRVLLNATKH